MRCGVKGWSNVKLELLGAGHYLLDESPDAVADRIERSAAEPKRD